MEQASLPALLIVLVGLIPVVFLNKLLRNSS
jgi:ABC-type Fe3+ transport system permease subunit